MGPNFTGFINGSLYVQNPSTSRTNLGLGTIAIQNANNVDISGGSLNGCAFLSGTVDSCAISGSTVDTCVLNGVTIGNVTPAVGQFSTLIFNMNTAQISSNYLIDPNADISKMLHTSATIDITMHPWEDYPDGFTFGVTNDTSSTTASVHATGGNTINGAADASVDEYQSIIIQRSPITGKFSIIAECRSNA